MMIITTTYRRAAIEVENKKKSVRTFIVVVFRTS